MTKRTYLVAKIVVAVALLGAICSLIDRHSLAVALSSATPQYLLALALLVLLDRAFMAWKWYLLLTPLGATVPYSRLYLLYSVAPLVGTIIPVVVGNEAFRLYGLTSQGIKASTGLASMIIERLIGLIAVLFLAAAGFITAASLLAGQSGLVRSIASILGATTFIAAAALLFLFNGSANRRIMSLALRYNRMMVVRKLGELYESCVEYRRHVRRVIYVFGLTLLEQTVPLIGNVLLIYAFKIEVSLIQLIATVPIIVLVTRMPISIDGIGVQEGMYVLLFGLVGVTASQALVISVAARLVNIACALPFAFFYLATWTNSRDLRKVPVRVTCTARKELEQSATVRLPD